MGFYPTEDWQPLPASSATYAEKLKDSRWQRKRGRILERCSGKCEECGSTTGLEVHQCYYRFDREPWQYPDIALLALCGDCHKRRKHVEMDFRLFQQSLRTDELQSVQEMMSHCKYWYNSKALQTFLDAMWRTPGDFAVGGGGNGRPELTADRREKLQLSAKFGSLCEKLYLLFLTYGHPEDRSEPRTRGRL